MLFLVCNTFAQTETKEISDSLFSPVSITAEQDHARLLKLLGIDSLRPGPSGDSKAPDAANVDELIANPYPDLPDPLILIMHKKLLDHQI